jgi:hypothetical protein
MTRMTPTTDWMGDDDSGFGQRVSFIRHGETEILEGPNCVWTVPESGSDTIGTTAIRTVGDKLKGRPFESLWGHA